MQNTNNEDYVKNIDRINSNIDKKLKDAISMTQEIQETGIGILSELDKQRNQINSMRQKNDRINGDLTKSRIVLNNMKNREKICIIS